MVRGVRVLLLGTAGAPGVSGPWPAAALWQVCGITAPTEEVGDRGVEG